MRPHLFLLAALLIIFSIAPSLVFAQDKASGNGHLFDYDQKAPLDVQIKNTFDRPACTISDLTYASPKGGRASAYLVAPKSKENGRRPAILFGHWGGGDRAEFLPEAELYASVGVVSLLPDYPWDRAGDSRRALDFSLTHPDQDKETYIQAVLDMRRGLDLLLARPDVDAKRTAYIGHSYGAQWGAILSAVDRRFKTAVLVGGTPTMKDVLESSNDPGMEEFRQGLKPGLLEKYLAVNEPVDAINFISHAAPIPLFFQFATFEQNFSRAAMERYWNAASQPKSREWYDTAHDLNDPRALVDRAHWLEKQIGITPLAIAAKDASRKE